MTISTVHTHFNVFLFISHDGSPSTSLDDLFFFYLTELHFRISWLTLQEVEAGLVADEVTEVGVVGARAVEDAKTKKRSGEKTFSSWNHYLTSV